MFLRREPQRSDIKRRSGKLLLFPHGGEGVSRELPNQLEHFDALTRQKVINSEELPLQVYPYGISRQKLAEAIARQDLPVVLTRNLETARVILTQREHAKKDSKLEHLARHHQLPIHIVEASTVSEITRTLVRLLNMDEKYCDKGSSSDEMAALEEARLAVERVVIPLKQPVDLLPRSARVRKMQVSAQ